MRVLIAADSFKEALSAEAVCRAIGQGLSARIPAVTNDEFPLADGGEGTLAVLAKHLDLSLQLVPASDPLNRPIAAAIGMGPGLTVIESAAVCGLGLLEPGERNPCATTTRGLGQLLQAAIDQGAEKVLLGIGGTATNDGGVGMATALGWQLLDGDGRPLALRGDALCALRRIVAPRTRALPRIEVLCDVTNPLLGPTGASAVFARQKGANDSDVATLERGLRRLAHCAHSQVDSAADPNAPGAGAAGGLGFGARLFLNAQLVRGIDAILDVVGFDAALSRADLVITGEGRIDAQTTHGKLIHGIAQRCRRANKPIIALCGQSTIGVDQSRALGIDAIHVIDESNAPLAEKIARTAASLEETARRIPLP